MINRLVRLFIQDCDNVTDPAVREKYGVLSGAVGIVLNLLLSAGKFFAGVVTGSIAITADAFNNLSDAGSSVVTLVGFKLAGLPGTLVAILGTIIPPFVIISVISVFYEAFRDSFLVSRMLHGMQAGVGAVIASVVYSMGSGVVHSKDFISILIMAAAFLASCVFGVNVIYIILICGMLGAVRTLFKKRHSPADTLHDK